MLISKLKNQLLMPLSESIALSKTSVRRLIILRSLTIKLTETL